MNTSLARIYGRLRHVFFTSLLAFTLGSAGASACEGKNELLRDKFTTPEPGWGDLQGEGASIEAGHLVLGVPPEYKGAGSWANRLLNQSDVFEDMSVCAIFKVANPNPSPAADNTIFGLVFWARDVNAYYTFNVSTIGSYSLARKIGTGRTMIYPISWTSSSDIKKGLNQSVELQVTVKGNVATLFVDGKKVGEVKGQVPNGGGLVGIYWSYPTEATPGNILVDDFQVRR
jgi:hypothetical protein